MLRQPVRLSDINSLAGLHRTQADIEARTAPDKIAQSGLETRTKQQTYDFNEKDNPLKLGGDQADLTNKQSQARVQIANEKPQISQASSQAAEASARAEVAKNGAMYDREGRWVDLFSKNPQMAIAQAGQYGVPPELLAIAQDQNKAKWLTDAWASISAQYPNVNDAATKAALFKQKLAESGSNPSASSAMALPDDAPPPTTRQDELRAQAMEINSQSPGALRPGTISYVAFMNSDGKILPSQFMTAEEVKAAGFPEGTVVDRSGKVVYKPKGGGAGPFAGTGMDAQVANILLNGDPGAPEYLAAYNMAAQPKTTFDPTSGRMVTTNPDMSAYRAPTYARQGGVPAPTQQGAAAPAPNVVAQAPGLTVTQIAPPTQKPPTEDQAKNLQLYKETSEQLPIALKHFDALGLAKNQVGALTPDTVQSYFTSPEYQQATNAVKTIVADYLYSVSGATANPGEVATRSTVITPRLGESANSIADKKARLQGMVEAIKIRASGGNPNPNLLDPSYRAAPSAQAGAPAADLSHLSDDDILKALSQ